MPRSIPPDALERTDLESKLNLKVEEVPVDRLGTTIEDRKSGRKLGFTLRPEFIRSIRDLPHERLEDEGRRVASLPDDAIFLVTETPSSRPQPRENAPSEQPAPGPR
jgi:hypothetical protein